MSDDEPIAMRSILRRARRATSADMEDEHDALPRQLSFSDLSLGGNSEHGSATPTPRASKFNNIVSPLSPKTPGSWTSSDSAAGPVALTGPKLSHQLAQKRSSGADTITSVATPSGSRTPRVDGVSPKSGFGPVSEGTCTDGSIGVGSPTGAIRVQEKLVEIKPRRRAKPARPEARRLGAVAGQQQSAFDGLPPAETYDQAWSSGSQFRVEGGQLRDRSDGNKPRAPLLPNAFKPLANDESDDDANPPVARNNTLEMLRRAAGAVVERRRNEVKCMRPPDEALDCTEGVLRRVFKAEIVTRRGLELRARVWVDEVDALISVVVNAEEMWRGARLLFRQSLTDRTKATPDRFLTWVDRVRVAVANSDSAET